MKKYTVILLSIIYILVLAACGGDVSNVKVTAYQSEIYTDNEIQSAIKATEKYFKKHPWILKIRYFKDTFAKESVFFCKILIILESY